MPYPVEGHLEVYEDMVEALLVLEMFLTKDSQVEDLLCGAPFCSEACLFFLLKSVLLISCVFWIIFQNAGSQLCFRFFFSNDILRLWLQSVKYGLQHDFAWVACEAVFYDQLQNLIIDQTLKKNILAMQGAGVQKWAFH